MDVPLPSAAFEINLQPSSEPESSLVIVIGWKGSQHKYLSKYSQWWFQRNNSVIQIVPADGFLLQTTVKRAKDQARQLLELCENIYSARNEAVAEGDDGIRSQRKHDRPALLPKILFHVFSNGGFIVYARVLTLLETDRFSYMVPHLCATIIDSAPAKVTVISTMRAFTAGFANRNFVVRAVISFCFTALFAVLFLLAWALRRGDFHKAAGFDDILESQVQKKLPILYLYSKDDNISDYRYIEEYADVQRALGIEVTTYCLKGRSAHVAHFYYQKEQYATQIDQFLLQLGTLHKSSDTLSHGK